MLNRCLLPLRLLLQNPQPPLSRSPESADIVIGAGLALSLGTITIDPSAFNDITRLILGCAIEVHRALGPGLLESIYMPCLQFELAARKLRFVVQRTIPITYKGIPLDAGYRVDLIVEDLVVVEVKSVAALLQVHQSQTLTYMRLTECPAGLLINFNVPRLMDGVKRLINSRTGRGDGGVGGNGKGGDGANGITQRNEETEKKK